jgi:hypothetical protein
MSDYRMMGQAMRRRAGASSSTLGGADKKVSVEVPDAINEMLNASSARLSVGAVRGKLIPKKSTQAADPTVMGPKAKRAPMQAGAEKLGPACRITSSYSVTSPEAASTMRNGRIVSSTMGTRASLTDSIHDSRG